MAASFQITNYAGTTTPASDIIGLVEARLTAAGWVFVEEYVFTQNMGATATTTSGSATLSSVSGGSNVQNGWAVGGAGIPAGTTVVSGGGSTSVVMSQMATASASGVTLTASRAMRVWKNPASLNMSGADFYVGFVKDVSGGPRLAVRAFEGWDTTAKTIQNPCIQGSVSTGSNVTSFAANVATNGVGTGAASWSPAGTTTPLMVDNIPPLLVTNNLNLDIAVLASKSYVVLSIAQNGAAFTYASWVLGYYSPGWTDNQGIFPPLAVVDLLNTSGTTTATTGVSRAMRSTTSSTSNWAASTGPESIMMGFVTATGLSKEKATQTVRASRVIVGSYGQPFNIGGGYRGLLYDAMALATDGSLKLGDTVNVGSAIWTVFTPNVVNPVFASFTSTVNVAYLFNTATGS